MSCSTLSVVPLHKNRSPNGRVATFDDEMENIKKMWKSKIETPFGCFLIESMFWPKTSSPTRASCYLRIRHSYHPNMFSSSNKIFEYFLFIFFSFVGILEFQLSDKIINRLYEQMHNSFVEIEKKRTGSRSLHKRSLFLNVCCWRCVHLRLKWISFRFTSECYSECSPILTRMRIIRFPLTNIAENTRTFLCVFINVSSRLYLSL